MNTWFRVRVGVGGYLSSHDLGQSYLGMRGTNRVLPRTVYSDNTGRKDFVFEIDQRVGPRQAVGKNMVFRDWETEIERGVRCNRFCCCIQLLAFVVGRKFITSCACTVRCTAVIVMVK